MGSIYDLLTIPLPPKTRGLRVYVRKPITERFWALVTKTDDCWTWDAATDKDGYGLFTIESGFIIKAHRASYILANGDIENSLWVLHNCDNPTCVRPSHLYLGTAQNNSDDMISRGRENFPKGSARTQSKLVEEDIIYIRQLRKDGLTLVEIASYYGVSFQLISQILNNKIWLHVPSEVIE